VINTGIKLSSGGVIHSDYLAHAQANFLAENELDNFIASCGSPLRKSIRVNTLKISVEKFKTIADSYHWKLTPIPWCAEAFWLEFTYGEQDFLLGNTPEHIQGLFYVQESSSMLPPFALLKEQNIEQPLIVDMAAAPGSKTTQIAAMLNNQGIVLANELSASRLKFLSANLVRCGILNTAMSHLDARKIGTFMPGQFDYVLLDAPCGCEGTVRKDINALKNWSLDAVKEIAKLQKELILSAYAALKPGGKMVYSTCTLSPEENQQVANYLVEQTDAVIEPLNHLFEGANEAVDENGYLLVLPHQFDSEGFFIASFRKPNSEVETVPLKEIYQSPFVEINRKIKKQVIDYYLAHFAINIDLDGYELLQRDKEVWLFPENISRLNSHMKINRAGLKLAQVYPNKIRSSHEFACCIGELAGRQKVEMDRSQLEQFMQGRNIEVTPELVDQGEVLLCFQGSIVGLGQNQKGKVKSGLPRELVKDNYRYPIC